MELHERIRGRQRDPDEIDAPFAELKNRIHQSVITDLGPQLYQQNMDPDALRARVTGAIKSELAIEHGLSREDRERLADEIADDSLGHGPIEKLLGDENITEIMVN